MKLTLAQLKKLDITAEIVSTCVGLLQKELSDSYFLEDFKKNLYKKVLEDLIPFHHSLTQAEQENLSENTEMISVSGLKDIFTTVVRWCVAHIVSQNTLHSNKYYISSEMNYGTSLTEAHEGKS